MIDNIDIVNKLSKLKYIKISCASDVPLLCNHYTEKNWTSSSNQTLRISLKHLLKHKDKFPILLEYHDNFCWNVIGSYLSLNGRKERNLLEFSEKSILDFSYVIKHETITSEHLFYMLESICDSKKYYLLL